MQHDFFNHQSITIGTGAPNAIESSIDVAGLDGVLTSVSVVVAIDHTWVSDLVVALVAPSGTVVELARNVGGSGDDLLATFTDDAPFPISAGTPPFLETFRPREPLVSLAGSEPDGRWRLIVVDQAWHDGGELTSWGIRLTTVASEPGHPIEVVFTGGLTVDQEQAFAEAAAIWSQVLRVSVPPVVVGGDTIDGVRIEASGIHIDGPDGILGQAGPVAIRSGTMIPATGIMQFDTGDLANMELHGTLVDVIVHEMGHVLGIGTLWKPKLLVADSGTINPTFVGAQAMVEFGALSGEAGPAPVPLANTGGPGTREGHWRESVFGNELMTGYVDTGSNPLSRLTIASLLDIGYQADLDAADLFSLPSSLRLAMLGVGGDLGSHQCCTLAPTGRHPGMVPLPPSALAA